MLSELFPHDWQQQWKGDYIMTKTFTINPGDHPTAEQLKEVEEAKNSPIIFDEKCEELSPAMTKAFRCAVVQRNRKRNA